MSANTTKYDDLGKDGNDMLSRGFPANNGLKINFESNFSGVELKSSFERSMKDRKESVALIFEPSIAIEKYLSIKGKLTTKAENEVSMVAKDYVVAGSVVEVGASQKTKSNFLSLGFVNQNLNCSVKLESPMVVGGPLKANVAGVIQYPSNVYWGANAILTKPEKKDYEYTVNGRIHFVFPSHSTTMLFDETKSKTQQLSLLYTQKLSDSLKCSTKFTLDSDLKVDPVFEAVVENKIDGDSTLKSKIHFSTNKEQNFTNMRLAFGYSSKVSKLCTFTVGADLNAFELIGNKGGEGHSLGFEIKLK